MATMRELWRDDPGWPVDEDIIFDTYFKYRAKGELPGIGGWFEQDTHIIDAFKRMDNMVEWHKLNEDKRKLPGNDWAAQRRKSLQDKQ
jgi:hypothetical protein